MNAKRTAACVGLCLSILGAALAAAPLSPAQAEPVATRPPRSTPATKPIPPSPETQPGSAGAQIELRVKPVTAGWPTLWTVVEWQDAKGKWHAVEGWHGGLDEAAGGEGTKTWWVYQRDLGKGLFRWIVLDRPDGRVLSVSEPFSLPSMSGQVTSVAARLS